MDAAIYKNGSFVTLHKVNGKRDDLPGKHTVMGLTLPYSYDDYALYPVERPAVNLKAHQYAADNGTGALENNKHVIPRIAVERPIDVVREEMIAKVKDRASRQILGRFPLFKQHNMNMRANMLQEIRFEGDTLNAAEEAERIQLKANGKWIEDTRAASDAIEADIQSSDMDGLRALNVENDARWPAP